MSNNIKVSNNNSNESKDENIIRASLPQNISPNNNQVINNINSFEMTPMNTNNQKNINNNFNATNKGNINKNFNRPKRCNTSDRFFKKNTLPNKMQNKNKENNNNPIKNEKIVLNIIIRKEIYIQLDQQNKTNTEFLLRLFFHLYKMNIIIKNSFKMDNFVEGFFVNNNLIEKYKNFYDFNHLENLLKTPKIQTIINNNKIKNLSGYISESSINKIIPEIIDLLSEEYKNIIQKKNNNEFIKEINNPENYSLNIQNYNNPNVFNIINCILLREEVFHSLIKDKNEMVIERLNNSKNKFIIIKRKCICVYNHIINIGILNENSIFKSEILIKYNDEETLNLIINDLKENSFDDFVNKINIINNNIGKYKDMDNRLIILEEKYITRNNSQSQSNNNNINKNYNTHNEIDLKIKSPMSIGKVAKKEEGKNIKFIVYVMIDLFKVKKNVENSLNNKNYNEKYIPINNLLGIYQDENLNSMIKNSDINLSNEDIFQNIIKSNILPELKGKNEPIYLDKDIFPKKINIKLNIFYYNNFKLLNKDTLNLLGKFSSIKDFEDITCYFRDKKIYMIFNQKNWVQIYYLNQQDNIMPELFFVFDSEEDLKHQALSLTKIGYKEYIEKYTLLKKEDYYSPIFIKDNRIAGHIYIFNNDKNYKRIHLRNSKLVGMIKLFFEYAERKIKNNKIKERKLHLVNNQLIKILKTEYDYDNLVRKLNEINEVKQIMELIKKGNGDYSNLLTYKKIYLIIKELPKEINNKFGKKNKENNLYDFEEELQLKTINNTNIMYYDDFELIEDNIYNTLFKNKEKDYLNKYYIYINSTKKYLYFSIPEIINKYNEKKYMIEVGLLKEDKFIPYYILVYNTKESCEQALNPDKKIDLDSLLDNYNFENNNFGKLQNEQNNEIGFIYSLRENPIKIGINKSEFNNCNEIQKEIKINNNENVITNNNQSNNNNKPVQNNNFINIQNNNNINNFFIMNDFKPEKNNNIINIQNNLNNIPIPQQRFFSQDKINLKKNEIEAKPIKEDFKTPILIGLQYIGGTPIYVNAILQCFCQIEEFVNYFRCREKVKLIINEYKNEKKENLTSSFKFLIDNLWPFQMDECNNKLFQNANNYYFAPFEIINKLYLLNPILKNSMSPKDITNFILESLHFELKKKNQNNMFSRIINSPNIQEAFDNFYQRFSSNISKISDIFFGVNKICFSCSFCNFTLYDFESFYSLYFDLWKVKSFKMDNQFNNSLSGNINIYDCLDYYRRIDYQIANKFIICQGCNNSSKYSQITSIFSAPKILIISLNLSKEIQNQINFNLEECLYLSNYVENKINDCIYNLRELVAFNLINGQYISYCKNPINQKWYKYDNDLVTLLNNDIVDEININSFFPCVLFYHNEK